MDIIFMMPILLATIMAVLILLSHQGLAQIVAQLIFLILVLEMILYSINLRSGKDT